MLQTKKITLRAIALSLCCLMAVTSVFCVPVSAVYENVISIADNVISKDYVGDEVIVNYQLPLNPRFFFYGRKTTSSSLTYLGTYKDMLFEQDIENNTATITTNFLNFMVNCPVGETRQGTVPGVETADFFARMEYLSAVEFNGVEVDYWLFTDDTYLYSYGLNVYVKNTSSLLARYSFFATADDAAPFYEVTNVAGKSANTLKLYGTEENPDYVNYYDYILFEGYPLGRYYPYGESSVPYYIDISDVRSGAEFDLTFKLKYTLLDDGGALYEDFDLQAHFMDENMTRISTGHVYIDSPNKTDTYNATFTVPSGAKYLYLLLRSREIDVKQCELLHFTFDNLVMSVALSAIEDSSKTQQEIANKLDELDGKIDGVIDGLGSIEDVLKGTNDRLDDVNDKLDDTNDKLDELPGQIGDEMQGVIDKEEQENTSAGQEFVDQILDILPDSSTEIMGALKGLTDAMSYTGTEAVITIPGITMPAVGTLIPRTVLWDGANMDFGEYVEMLPSLVLTLVRYLFTIAIVLYCAYELKGIVSYCLTLKESKGG